MQATFSLDVRVVEIRGTVRLNTRSQLYVPKSAVVMARD